MYVYYYLFHNIMKHNVFFEGNFNILCSIIGPIEIKRYYTYIGIIDISVQNLKQ